jgi:hypothetical protein
MSYSVLEKEERGYSAARPRGTPAGPGVTSAVAALHAMLRVGTAQRP